jgi:hypothetical protein
MDMVSAVHLSVTVYVVYVLLKVHLPSAHPFLCSYLYYHFRMSICMVSAVHLSVTILKVLLKVHRPSAPPLCSYLYY